MRTKPFAFQNRLFVTYVIVVLAVVVLFTAALLITTTDMNRRTELYHQQELYKNHLGEVQGILTRMERLAEQVASNNEILGGFMPLAADGDESNYFEKNLIDSIHIGSLLAGVNGATGQAARVSVFNGHGDYVSAGSLYETPQVLLQVLESAFYGDLIKKIENARGQIYITSFHADTWSSNPNSKLMSLYRPLSSYTNTIYGVVDIQVSAGVFSEQAFWQSANQTYTIFSSTGEVVYPFDQAQQDIFPLISAQIPAGFEGAKTIEMQVNGQAALVMGARALPSDWLFVRVLPSSELLRPYANNTIIILVSSAALLGCLVLIMYYLSGRIAGPLRELSGSIESVNLQNIKETINNMQTSYTTEELEMLSRAFQSTLMRLDRSLSMEIQAHMRALQSQMNPHFLFNMLSVIVESSEESGDKRTVSMCLKLSAMLRYIADYHGDNASLEEELQHTKNYLDLMKDRYEDLFDYEIITHGPLDLIQVPKMIIQPLAENCFSHGFKDCRPPWHIRIESKADKGEWSLKMADNGSGITAEKVKEIQEKVETYRSDVATNYKNLRLGGMGLVNTLLRLALAQNDRLNFSIRQREEGGTLIKVGGSYDDSGIDS